jgi:redox-sensitive bicupin YhaK (pirin superfamily)
MEIISYVVEGALYACVLEAGQTVAHELNGSRRGWVQIVGGRVRVNGTELNRGDAARVEGVSGLRLHAVDETELLVFDLA